MLIVFVNYYFKQQLALSLSKKKTTNMETYFIYIRKHSDIKFI